MNKYLPIASVVGALLLIIVGFLIGQSGLIKSYSGIKISGMNQVSSDILFLTQPVTNFSGKVDKVEGNAVWVSQQFTLAQNYTMAPPPVLTPGQSSPAIPTPIPPKNISYKVLVNSNTQISRPPVYISYLLITPPPSVPVKLSVKDIKQGQFITLNTNTDLRTISGNEFTANSIQLPQIQNSINGKISSISGNTLLVKAFAPIQNGPGGMAIGSATIPPPKEVIYSVTVTDATEISRYGQMEPSKETETPKEGGLINKPPAPEKLSVSDLKADMQITVYADIDVTATQKFTALRIEPMIVIASPPVLQVSQPPILHPPSDSTGSGIPTITTVISPVSVK